MFKTMNFLMFIDGEFTENEYKWEKGVLGK